MAAPANANMTSAVDRLAMMFPTIERPTIKNILVNECQGDSTKSIVILTRIQQFNQSMNNVNNNQDTANSGEMQKLTASAVVPTQQIPLQIATSPQQPVQYANQNNCCGEDNSCGCACCLMKPASYNNGLYRIDYKMYNISFLLFSFCTFYPDLDLYSLSTSYQGLYLPFIGLLFIFIASFFMFFINGNNDIGHENKCGSIRGGLFIFGGLLYMLGYIIHAFTVPEDYGYGWYFYGDMFPEPQYLIGRGLFVGIHAMFVGYLYVANNKTPKCCKDRISLIRFWTFLFLIYNALALCGMITIWAIIVFMALSPFVTMITLFLNCCLIKKSNEAGGCNSGVSLGLIIVVSYYFQVFWFFFFVMISRFEAYDDEYKHPLWYVVWDLALLVFGSMQLWILTRAMHPANANCGCVQDGSGDGNVTLTAASVPQQVVMVVQQPQTQTVVVPTAVVAQAAPVNDDGELDGYNDEDGNRNKDEQLYVEVATKESDENP